MSKSQSKASVRNTTPPAINTMSVTEFVRGGLYDIDTPTTVVSHGNELGTWYPRGQGVTANYYAASTTTAQVPNGFATRNFVGSLAAAAPPADEPLDVAGLNDAVRQMKEYLARLPKAEEGEEKHG